MNWIHVLTTSKDQIGLSESWDINVALTQDGHYAWQTSGCDTDEQEAIDSGSAVFIAEYLVDNAEGMEIELINGLSHIAEKDPAFTPLLNAVRAQLKNRGL